MNINICSTISFVYFHSICLFNCYLISFAYLVLFFNFIAHLSWKFVMYLKFQWFISQFRINIRQESSSLFRATPFVCALNLVWIYIHIYWYTCISVRERGTENVPFMSLLLSEGMKSAPLVVSTEEKNTSCFIFCCNGQSIVDPEIYLLDR